MTSKITNDSTAGSGTIERTIDACRRTSVARAQAELIDMLARLVLAAVEADAAGTRTHRPRDHARDRRPRRPTPDLPPWVVDRLTEAHQRIQNMTAGQKLWYERFTDADRAVFTEPWPAVWASNRGTVGLWCRARGTSWNRGIAEVAHALGFLDQASRDAIVAVLPPEDQAAAERAALRARRDAAPSWHATLGELRYRGEVIREVKPEAGNLRTILEAFEEDGWPPDIYDPFPQDDASDRRRRAVATLNAGLRGIRFTSTGNGRKISWQPVADGPSDASPPA